MALLPPHYIECVVAIGIINEKGKKIWIGTGFLFGKFDGKEGGKGKRYIVYLVTNRHVLKDQKQIIIRFNPHDDKPATDINVPLKKNEVDIWTGHPVEDVDVAVIRVDVSMLKTHKLKYAYFLSDTMVFDSKTMVKKGITEGDGVFSLGFPMGLVGIARKHVILRSGAIARIRDFFDGYVKDFVIDAFSFPGNSGGPVIIQPEVVTIDGTKVNNQAALIGLVKGYLTYREEAISSQTKRTRVIFEENTGLTMVEPVDHILQTIQEDNVRRAAVT